MNRLASALRAAGLAKHDRVAFLCPNIPAMLEAHYGVPGAGGILVAINTRLSSDEIGYILGHSGASFLFVDAELEPSSSSRSTSPASASCAWTTPGAPGDPYEDFLAQGAPAPVASWLEDEEETIAINYTSGTTGRPKGVMYSAPRRLHERPRRGDRVGHELRHALSLDAAHVPLQWLVLHLGA